jgi:hypothetical protein
MAEHTSLMKHLRPQLHHLRVGARESILYLPHDHVFDYLIMTFLDEPFLVPLPHVVRADIKLLDLHVLLALPRRNPTDTAAVLGVSQHID